MNRMNKTELRKYIDSVVKKQIFENQTKPEIEIPDEFTDVSGVIKVDGMDMIVADEKDTNGVMRGLWSSDFSWAYTRIYVDDNKVNQPMLPKMQKLLEEIAEGHKFDDVLVLGAGACGYPRYFIKKFNSDVIAIEYSQDVIDVANEYFFTEDYGDKLEIIKDDALKYVDECDGKFDLIFVDLFVDHHILEGVKTPEFLGNLKRLLNEGGVIIFNVLHTSMDDIKKIVKGLNLKEYRKVVIKGPNDEQELFVIG